MKISKLIKTIGTSLFLGGTSFTIPFVSTSCNTNNDAKYFDYIGHRTFSIAAIGADNDGIGSTSGTMWFYERLDRYKYEFITNYHVYDGMRTMIQQYNPSKEGTLNCLAVIPTDLNDKSSNNILNYIQWTNPFSTVDDFNDFIKPIYIQTQTSSSKPCYMDMCAITVDFSGAYNLSDLTNIGGTQKGVDAFRKEIRYLNNTYKIGDKISTNTGTSNKGAVSKGEKIYICGFPWGVSPATPSPRGWTKFTEVSTSCDKWYDNQILQVSNVYYTEETCWGLGDRDFFPLGGGASGSLVINSNYEAVGIYWGGQGDQAGTWFEPMFALFRTTSTQHKAFDFFATVDQTLAA